MPFTEDLSAFFSEAEFADAGVLDGAAVSGIFDNGYLEEMGMASHEARYTLPSAAAAGVTSASTLVVRGTTYRVRGTPQHDGTGVCTLLLELQ